MLATIILLSLQVGPHPGFGTMPGVPDELRNRPQREAIPDSSGQTAMLRAEQCRTSVEQDPAGTVVVSESQIRSLQGDARISALQCKGIALSELGRFDEAAESFLLARDAATDLAWRGALGAQRAFALAELGRIAEAQSTFAIAISEKLSGNDRKGAARIAADKAGVEVDAGDMSAARQTLEQAREILPEDARLWLLSATLARREDRLEEAQSHIERAAQLGADNPAIAPALGLEAGVIAALDGRLTTARQSFASVAAHPHAGTLAASARRYLQQLDLLENAPQ